MENGRPKKEIKFSVETKEDVNGNAEIRENGNDSLLPQFRSRLNSKVVYVDKKKYVEPPDGGWGWVIVLAVWVNNMLVLGVLKSLGVLYPEFRIYFQDYNSATISWINSISLSMRATAAPLAAALSNRFGEQKVVASGGVLVVLGFVLSRFAQSPYYLYVSLGCVAGFGFALASLPALTMIGRYFKRHRSLANGISRSGGGATFILAPLLQVLVVHYGWQGCLMIVGAIEMHLFVCAMLLRPLRLKEELKFDSSTTLRRHSVRKGSILPSTGNGAATEREIAMAKWYRRRTAEKDRVRALQREIEQKVKDDGITESLIVEHFPQIEPVYTPAKKKALKFALLKNPLWLILTINLVTAQFGYSITLVHTVNRAKLLGIGEYESVFLISFIGITEVASQLSSGFMADKLKIRKIHLHKIYVAIMALATIASLFVTSYLGMIIYCVVFGIGSGSWQGNILPVTVDTLGVVNLRSAYGFCLLFSGCCGQLIGPPVAGAIFDATGNYTMSFIVVAIFLIFSSSILWLEIPAAKYCKDKNNRVYKYNDEHANAVADLNQEIKDVTNSSNFIA